MNTVKTDVFVILLYYKRLIKYVKKNSIIKFQAFILIQVISDGIYIFLVMEISHLYEHN